MSALALGLELGRLTTRRVKSADRAGGPEPAFLAILTSRPAADYKGITPPWNDWRTVQEQCRSVARALLET
ncbi:MAG TPA: hypothetical protein VF329_15310 [Gammaproteobacteria bacterium]